jgi:hypothetical protein
MNKKDVIYYGLLFAAGVGVALWLRKEYNTLKQSSLTPKPKALSAFGVRG